MAVSQRQASIVGSIACPIAVVAILAEPVRAPAVVPGLRAAILALPVNKIFAVFLATGLSCTDLLQKAVLAE